MASNSELSIILGDATYRLGQIMRSSDVQTLSQLANLAADRGAKLSALSYLAAFRIYVLYQRVETASDAVLKRHLQIAKGLVVDENIGATALRRTYCEEFFGWSSFNAWADDWSSQSRSSIWMKVWDIEAWRAEGCDWDTIINLLSNVPMAAREAMDKPVNPRALPPAPDTGQPSKAEYLRELTTLPPGQARRKVSMDAGEPQIYVMESEFVHTLLYEGRTLLLCIRVETSSGVEDYDIVVHPALDHGAWGAVALWISDKLGKRIKIG